MVRVSINIIVVISIIFCIIDGYACPGNYDFINWYYILLFKYYVIFISL